MIILSTLIISLVVMGVVLYVVNQLPMPGYVAQIINAITCLCMLLWVLAQFGLLPHMVQIR